MKEKIKFSDYAARLAQQLNENDLSMIDFDDLRLRLEQYTARSSADDEIAEEHALLREDCQRRLAGMIKAIAAVERKRDSLESALTLVEELPSLKAAKLLQRYRQVSARFRDCFPASFAGVGTAPINRLEPSQVRDMK